MKKENGCYPASLKDALALKDLFPGEEAFCPEKILLDNNKDMKNKNGQMEDSVTTDESMKLTISCKKNVLTSNIWNFNISKMFRFCRT